ncbi:MAG TPA: DNA polymerase domain-containing protein, partial [Nitrososphaeraceae archaeon]|nr:DNA polymerase domain-containing protein [Nitrososphaeraceae archaeon]
DITSLYPTMIINNNISPETVNCSCCKHDIKARLVFDKDLLNDLKHGNVIENNEIIYWTCKRRTGLFSKILEELTQKRIQYKKEGKELESAAIKAIINSGYGVFGHTNFKYYDPKVAEVITTLGRQTFLEMTKVAIEFDFTVLYGDTDSLFVNNINNDEDVFKFIDDCKTRLNVAVTHEKTFKKRILVGKKHYVGIPYGNDKPVIKGMEGIKSDRPEFIHQVFLEMVKDIQKDTNPIPKLRKALEELDRRQVPKERLMISLTLSKNPQDYVNDCLQKRLGTKLKLKKGDILPYYKCDKLIRVCDQPGKQRIKTVGESDDPDDISYAKYKEMFINAVKDVIEILGYSVEKDLLAKRKLLYGS